MMMSKKMGLALGGAALALLASGCASNRIDFGGVMAPHEVPPNVIACEVSGWEPDRIVQPVYPSQLATFLYLNQSRTDVRDLTYSYDINSQGYTRNIRFVSPQHYTEHAALRSAILAGGEALAYSTFKHTGQNSPQYATGCSLTFSFGALFQQN